MTDDMNEKLLQEYLEGRSPVSDAYQAAEKSGPPPELDRAVLAEARAAARSGRDIGSPRWQAWLMPASLAATVTLCIALVAEVIVFDPLLRTADSPQTFRDTLEAEADAPVASPATPGRTSREQALIQQAPQRPADVMEAKQERGSALDEFARNTTMTTGEVPVSTVVVPARENLNAPEPTSDRRASEKTRAVQKDDVGVAVSSYSLQLATVAADERAAPAEDSDQSGREAAVVQGKVESAVSAEVGGGQASGGIEGIVATARSRTDSPAWPAADVWLAGIRFLFEQGEQERAEAELDKFREHYPDYPLGELVRGTDED